MPGGETGADVLRPLRAGADRPADAPSRRPRLDRRHRRGQPRCRDPVGGRDAGRRRERASRSNTTWPTPNRWCSRRSPTAGGAACTGVRRPRRSTPGRRTPQICQPTRWAERTRSPPRRSRSPGVRNQFGVAGNRDRCTPGARSEWRMTVPWQCSNPASHSRHVALMARSYHRRADKPGMPRPRLSRPEIGGRPQAQPSSCSRSSSMPKWWAISWMTVIATSSTTSSSESHISSSASR